MQALQARLYHQQPLTQHSCGLHKRSPPPRNACRPPTFAARKKGASAALLKQRSVAHIVQRTADGSSSLLAGTTAGGYKWQRGRPERGMQVSRCPKQRQRGWVQLAARFGKQVLNQLLGRLSRLSSQRARPGHLPTHLRR